MTPLSKIINHLASLKGIELDDEYLYDVEKSAGRAIALTWPSAIGNAELNVERTSEALRMKSEGKLYLKNSPTNYTFIDDLIKKQEDQKTAGLFIWNSDLRMRYYTILRVCDSLVRIRFHNGKEITITRNELARNSNLDYNNPKSLSCWTLISHF